MKDVHPDLSQDEEETTEFAALLNEIYATLMDPDRRAAYDAVAGFAFDGAGALNPFLDAELPRDSVFVDEFTCIGARRRRRLLLVVAVAQRCEAHSAAFEQGEKGSAHHLKTRQNRPRSDHT